MRKEHPTDQEFTVGCLLYCLAKAEPHRTTWKLEDETYESLIATETPWDLVAHRLPRLPFDGLLVRLPDNETINVITAQMPVPVPVRSLLLCEEVPGKKWRYIGLDDIPSSDNAVFTRGWLDVRMASARSLLVDGTSPGVDYRLTNEDAIWQLLINLFLANEQRQLEGGCARIKVPRGAAKRSFIKRSSTSDYTIVRLTPPPPGEPDPGSAPSRRLSHENRPHVVAGHWRSVWVRDPADRPVFETRPRKTRDGEEAEGFLYRVATWVRPFVKGDAEKVGESEYLIKP